jgi:AcrR family transcriptional regulator
MNVETSAARERVLETAERLFSEQGYAAVTLRDIADALKMKQASLYYHVPGGKEALYVEVMQRAMARHREGLQTAIATAEEVRGKLRAAARWLLTQPAINYGRIMQTDMPAVSEAHQAALRQSTHQALIATLAAVFAPIVERRQEPRSRAVYLAGAFLAVVETVVQLPAAFGGEPRTTMVDYLIDIMLDGLLNDPHDLANQPITKEE